MNSLKHIKYRNEIPENTCKCDYCENIELMLKAFRLVIDEETSLDSVEMLVDQICFNPQSLSCVDGSHKNCGAHSPKFKELCKKVSEIDEVSFYKWVSGENFSEKRLVQLTGSEASEELTKQIKFYLVHNYNKWRQGKEIRFLKSSLDDTAAVIQVDLFGKLHKHTRDRSDGDLKYQSFCFITDEDR